MFSYDHPTDKGSDTTLFEHCIEWTYYEDIQQGAETHG